ncbi:MAG TPA: c-type cytochrome [Rhizomicrobium sp.]|nr:c-type cytochrome [Rhizomicrobium sp.]
MKRFALLAALLLASAAPTLAQRGPQQPPNPMIGNQQAVQQGGAIYAKNCTGCHGPEGAAGEIGPAIVSGTQADRRNDGQILTTIRSGVTGTSMPAFAGKLADDDILRIGAYLHALRGTAIDNPSPGNAQAGEQIFFGKGQCSTCHMLKGRGGMSAPDLSNIAGQRKTVSIVDALTKPEHHIYGDGGSHLLSLPAMDTWLPVHVTTSDGRTVNGVLLNEDSYSVQIMGDDQQLHMFLRPELRRFEVEAKSRMPTDYDKRLAPGEFRDLLAFLTRQATETKTAASGGDNN